MNETESYNGWTNRETWAVALYINNDQGWQESVFEALREAHLEQRGSVLEGATAADHMRVQGRMAGEIIRENVEAIFDVDVLEAPSAENLRNTLLVVRDIGSLWRVNWDELGATFLQDAKEANES